MLLSFEQCKQQQVPFCCRLWCVCQVQRGREWMNQDIILGLCGTWFFSDFLWLHSSPRYLCFLQEIMFPCFSFPVTLKEFWEGTAAKPMQFAELLSWVEFELFLPHISVLIHMEGVIFFYIGMDGWLLELHLCSSCVTQCVYLSRCKTYVTDEWKTCLYWFQKWETKSLK